MFPDIVKFPQRAKSLSPPPPQCCVENHCSNGQLTGGEFLESSSSFDFHGLILSYPLPTWLAAPSSFSGGKWWPWVPQASTLCFSFQSVCILGNLVIHGFNINLKAVFSGKIPKAPVCVMSLHTLRSPLLSFTALISHCKSSIIHS